jgi:hypothetical protein
MDTELPLAEGLRSQGVRDAVRKARVPEDRSTVGGLDTPRTEVGCPKREVR